MNTYIRSNSYKPLSEDQFMQMEFAKSDIKNKYGKVGLLCFTEYMQNIVIPNSHLKFNELIYIDELLAKDASQYLGEHCRPSLGRI